MNRSLAIALALAACGDNHTTPDARSMAGDSVADAHVPKPQAAAVAGDFGSPGTGLLSRLDIETLDMRQNLVPSVAQGDPALRHFDGKLYIINRFGSNNVTVVNAKTLQLEDQLSTGANSNPQDVAVVGTKLYVPAMGTAGVVVLTRGSATIKTIDLSALDSVGANDGLPDCVSAYAVGTQVFVACGVLDGFAATEVGKIAVIDSTTDTVTTSFAMNHRNPYGFFTRTPESSAYTGDLLIPSVPDFQNYAAGCLERISTGAAPASACGLTNQQMGGFATKLTVAADGSMLYIALGTYDSQFNATGTLRGFNLGSGELRAPLSTTSQLIVDVAACPGGDVVAMDQKMNAAGVRVWHNATERTTDAKSIGLPPTVNALVCYDP